MTLSPRANAPPTLFPGGAHPRRPPGLVGRGGAGKHSKSLPLKRAGDLSGADFAPMWWRRMDSNHRRQSQQIYSLSPLATWVLLRMQLAEEGGAGGRIRTPDLLITNQLLYRLSYTSAEVFRIHSGAYYNSSRRACQPFFQKNSKIQKGEEMAAHGILEPSTPGGAAVLPVRGGALPRRPLFRAGQPGGMRGLPGAVCPAVFRRAAAPGGPGAAAAAATLFLRQRSTRENL